MATRGFLARHRIVRNAIRIYVSPDPDIPQQDQDRGENVNR